MKIFGRGRKAKRLCSLFDRYIVAERSVLESKQEIHRLGETIKCPQIERIKSEIWGVVEPVKIVCLDTHESFLSVFRESQNVPDQQDLN